MYDYAVTQPKDGPVQIDVRVSGNPMPAPDDFFSWIETEPKPKAQTLKLYGAPSVESGDGTRIRALFIVLDKGKFPFNLTISDGRGRIVVRQPIDFKPPPGGSPGAVIGIIIVTLIVIVAVGLAAGFYWKRRKEEKDEEMRIQGFRVRLGSSLPVPRKESIFAPLSVR